MGQSAIIKIINQNLKKQRTRTKPKKKKSRMGRFKPKK